MRNGTILSAAYFDDGHCSGNGPYHYKLYLCHGDYLVAKLCQTNTKYRDFLKQNDYVTASRVMGTSHTRMLFKEILPNSIGPLIVMCTLDLGNAILMLSGLSFLGLGVKPPMAEWGAMVSEGVRASTNWWVATFLGLAIFSVAIGANFVGDGLRDYLDPKTRKNVGISPNSKGGTTMKKITLGDVPITGLPLCEMQKFFGASGNYTDISMSVVTLLPGRRVPTEGTGKHEEGEYALFIEGGSLHRKRGILRSL